MGLSGFTAVHPTSLRCRAVQSPFIRLTSTPRRHLRIRASHVVKENSDAERTTEKYGLEAGLVQVFTSKEANSSKESRTQQAKRLLAQYGSAYLITSISFAVVSFSVCYILVETGVDVASVLSNIGLSVQAGSTQEQVGTLAIAYAAHKALSPVRFPPTVALTPVVAKWLGSKKEAKSE